MKMFHQEKWIRWFTSCCCQHALIPTNLFFLGSFYGVDGDRLHALKKKTAVMFEINMITSNDSLLLLWNDAGDLLWLTNYKHNFYSLSF